ncbi:MAG TPA: monovalent cation/H(+) antiporter subunit G [Trebonia sp.]|jgi:multisubunit Na+/H+ antiporter MnhG subunit|nr:monovalent cation/H(+) antiporter subunit G [Trebonia sp.]
MTVRDVAAGVFLALAALIVVASAIGVLVMPGATRKLHYVTPVAVVAPVFVALAVLAEGGLDYGTGQAWLTVALLLFAGPFLSHATIRAIRTRQEGDADDDGRP